MYQIRAIVSHWIADPSVQVIISTGGNRFYGRDNTPEAVSALFDKTIDGFGEQFRAISVADIGMSTIQSRAVAGMANHTAIFCLPGSTGACRTAWEGILQEQLDNRTVRAILWCTLPQKRRLIEWFISMNNDTNLLHSSLPSHPMTSYLI